MQSRLMTVTEYGLLTVKFVFQINKLGIGMKYK